RNDNINTSVDLTCCVHIKKQNTVDQSITRFYLSAIDLSVEKFELYRGEYLVYFLFNSVDFQLNEIVYCILLLFNIGDFLSQPRFFIKQFTNTFVCCYNLIIYLKSGFQLRNLSIQFCFLIFQFLSVVFRKFKSE